MKEPAYVEVEKEPLHRQIFENRNIRVYRAVLKPGLETMYHRHSRDTVYITASGGKMKSLYRAGSLRCKTILPAGLGTGEKVQLLISSLTGGWTELMDGFFFAMKTGDRPIIHCAQTYKKNRHLVDLYGVELKDKKGAKLEFSSLNRYQHISINGWSVYRISLLEGEKINLSCLPPLFCLVISGRVNFRFEDKSTLKGPGEYFWNGNGYLDEAVSEEAGAEFFLFISNK